VQIQIEERQPTNATLMKEIDPNVYIHPSLLYI
jgi:hypothetical protein